MNDYTDILPIGTRIAGYAPPKDGPFKCDNCIHFDRTPVFHCDHPAVRSDYQMKKDSQGRPLVMPDGCCTYFRKA